MPPADTHTDTPPLLDVRDVTKWFPLNDSLLRRFTGYVKALDGVSFSMRKGEILGLVGESGCGKSTLGRVILHLLKPTSGSVWFDGRNVNEYSQRGIDGLRRRMQIIFQDPHSSLNPRLSVGTALREAMTIHRAFPKQERDARIKQLLERVGLNAFHAQQYPHEFSGGQRQRIGIARALAVDPDFILCDEPVSSLDVSIQAQIINLLLDLRASLHLTYLFISHDLHVITHISDRVAVMYLGRLVELAETESLLRAPLHPYTQALLASVPVPDPRTPRKPVYLSGEVPSPAAVPTGCAFHPRCPVVMEDCATVAPRFAEHPQGHFVSCLQYDVCWPVGDNAACAASPEPAG
jgi:oligopeptide transport system ATP-binding protein